VICSFASQLASKFVLSGIGTNEKEVPDAVHLPRIKRKSKNPMTVAKTTKYPNAIHVVVSVGITGFT